MNNPSPFDVSSTHKQSVKKIQTVTLYTHSKENDALGYLRLLGPAKKLGINVIEGMEDDQIYPERVNDGDVVILQRDFSSHLAEYEKIMSLSHEHGKPVILDLDDLLLELPEEHPERKSHYYARALLPLLRALMEVDLVTVSTTRLRDVVTPFNRNVFVLPNCLNDDLWDLRKPSPSIEEQRPIIIGYMGGLSHQPDLDLVLPVLLRLNNRYPRRLQFNFWGIRPPTELVSSAQVRWFHPDTRRYPDFATYFQTQTADIFIGPLVDNLFNSCKSPIKYFEYSALGVPGVYSRLGPYLDVITHGQDGLLASSPEEWTHCLKNIIEDPELRFSIATGAQNTIRSRWLLSENASKWLQAFEEALACMDRKKTNESPFLDLVKSLTAQIAEDQDDKSHQINGLKAKLHAQAPLVAELGIFKPYIKFKVYRRIQKDMALIQRSGLFDEKWYCEHNSDIVRAKVDPLLHFLRHGGFERRDPSPHFSSGWYLDSYEDVKFAGINPLVHYLKYGIYEGRIPNSEQVEQEITYTDTLRRLHPIRAQLIPYGSRREKLLFGIKKAILFPIGIFNKAKRQKIQYILKNYGVGGLIAATFESARVTFVEGLVGRNLVNRVKQNRLVVLARRKKQEYKAKQNEYGVQARLKEYLSSNAVLELPRIDEPVITVVLLLYNRAEMSLQCLQSLTEGAGAVPFEVVIVDNASSDQTPALLDRIHNATIIRNPTNLGFGGGNNQAAEAAKGKYLLFLNNDTKLLPGALPTLLETLEADPSIGAVGGKLIFPDGRLQEAGSLLWRDGSALGYGRFDDPFQPEYCFVRDVDFCSGALLLTPRELFLSLGKFDPRYAPAYYEDADYCVQLWAQGYRVVFQPFAAAIHYEYGSSGSERALALQREHRLIFADKWEQYLAKLPMPDPSKILLARQHPSDKKRLLLIDDRIPDYRLGSGYPRTYKMLELLVDMGYKLTFFPMQISAYVPDLTPRLQKLGVEVYYKQTEREDPRQKINFEAFLRSRKNYYDAIFISRPHNMQEGLQPLKQHAGDVPIIYDAEALFALRDVKFREINGEYVSELEKERLVKAEVALVKAADAVITVSEFEKQHFVRYGTASVHVLSHILQPNPTPAPFQERRDILFIGSIMFDPSPNGDAVRYFATQILPLVRQEVDCDFYIVGTNRIKAIWNLDSEHVHVIGKVEDLLPYYNRSRLFVVPTRYSAGIPLKLLEASAHGLPAVVTPLTALQLGWQEDRDLLVGHDPEDFARQVVALYTQETLFETLRHNALERIHNEYSINHFQETLQKILKLTVAK